MDETKTELIGLNEKLLLKLYLQLLQQKGVTPDTESKDSHTFAMYRYVTLSA